MRKFNEYTENVFNRKEESSFLSELKNYIYKYKNPQTREESIKNINKSIKSGLLSKQKLKDISEKIQNSNFKKIINDIISDPRVKDAFFGFDDVIKNQSSQELSGIRLS
jgi:hypothetical protein